MLTYSFLKGIICVEKTIPALTFLTISLYFLFFYKDELELLYSFVTFLFTTTIRPEYLGFLPLWLLEFFALFIKNKRSNNKNNKNKSKKKSVKILAKKVNLKRLILTSTIISFFYIYPIYVNFATYLNKNYLINESKGKFLWQDIGFKNLIYN